jgi:precorrin-6B C5,15-methyltransferase / cobalt-precorrin-6B C5,C15-methyltransferase
MIVQMIGVGPGSEALLTPEALQKIKEADLVLTNERLFEAFGYLNFNTKCCTLSAIEALIREHKNLSKVAILASGDVGFYSLSNTLKPVLEDVQVEWVNGISSLQYLAARLKQDYSSVKVVSVHGRDRSVIPYVSYHENVFVLTGGAHKAHDVIADLVRSGLGGVRVTAGENLSMAAERLITAEAHQLQDLRFDNLSVLWINNPQYVSRSNTLSDEDFERGSVPMTKEAVREYSLAKLDIQPGEIVFDIGAGTGSVAMAMARRAHESFVYAVEKSQDAIELIRRNRQKLGAFNIKLIEGTAPECLEDLPAPNKVFIGGAGGKVDAVIDAVLGKNPRARIVVNAITLETLQETLQSFERHNFRSQIQCLAVTEVEAVGRHHMMKAQNPIYVMMGECVGG